MRIECLDVLNRVRQPVVRLLTRFLHHQDHQEVGIRLIPCARWYEDPTWYSRYHDEPNNPFLSKTSHYSGGDTRRHELQRAGYSGRNNAELHALNCRLTDALSNDEIVRRIIDRRSRRLPTGQLEAAARDRGIKFYNE